MKIFTGCTLGPGAQISARGCSQRTEEPTSGPYEGRPATNSQVGIQGTMKAFTPSCPCLRQRATQFSTLQEPG